MRKLFPIILSMLCAHASNAQQTFMNYYNGFGGWVNCSVMIELASHNIVTDMGYPSADLPPWTSLLGPDGSLLQAQTYVGDSIGGLCAMAKDLDNRLYSTSYYFSGTTCNLNGQSYQQFYPALGTMDSLGHLNDMHYYVLNGACESLPFGLNVMDDHGAVIWGADLTEFAGGVGVGSFAFRVDSSGSLHWARHFNSHGSIGFVKELPSGDLLMGMKLDTAGAVVTRLSANGDIIWSKSYFRPSGVVQDGLILSDNAFLVTGYTDGFAADQGALFAMKLDGAGSVIWCKGYSVPSLFEGTPGRRIVPADEGHYVLLADIRDPMFSATAHPLLMKIDENGDTLWTRAYGSAGLEYAASNLLACSDGGFLFSGHVGGYLQTNNDEASYLIKVDSAGHLLCNERCPGVNVTPLLPVDSSFVLSYEAGGSDFAAYAMDSAGLAFAEFDGCSFNGFTEMLQMQFSIYPNPSTGRFTLSFSESPAAAGSYAVYDTMGRLLHQRPLSKGQRTEEVDLSRFSKGAYVIALTDKEGACHRRVVVE